jgi:hypothetical protein
LLDVLVFRDEREKLLTPCLIFPADSQ